MEHVDPEVLALIALGEPVATEADTAHLAACPECSDEVAALAATVSTSRSLTAADTLVAPPAAVWDRIRDELGLADGVHPDGPAAHGAGAEVIDLASRTRRARRFAWVATAAAAGLVVGVAGGAWWTGRTGDGTPSQSVVASTALAPLPGWTVTGQAKVEKEPDGTRVLVLALDKGVSDGGYREVWLIDRSVTRLVSLGVLEGATGTFTIPPGLDLTDYPIVDVSQQDFNGNPAHSGNSIIRGTLPVA